jgi:hypothetical protein
MRLVRLVLVAAALVVGAAFLVPTAHAQSWNGWLEYDYWGFWTPVSPLLEDGTHQYRREPAKERLSRELAEQFYLDWGARPTYVRQAAYNPYKCARLSSALDEC